MIEIGIYQSSMVIMNKWKVSDIVIGIFFLQQAFEFCDVINGFHEGTTALNNNTYCSSIFINIPITHANNIGMEMTKKIMCRVKPPCY
jgi:hypothetical protein